MQSNWMLYAITAWLWRFRLRNCSADIDETWQEEFFTELNFIFKIRSNVFIIVVST
jgi:hypothetical protein